MKDEATPAKVRPNDGLGQASEAPTLVERLRQKFPDVAYHRDQLHLDAADEIARLQAALRTANDQAERFERGWYLRGDVLEKLRSWADAYPLKVFPEPNMARAHELLTAGGMTIDAISASNMRHVIEGVRHLVDEGLKA